MSENTETPTGGTGVAIDDDDWLTTTPAEPLESAEKTPPTSRRQLAIRAGLVAAGALVGAVVVASVSHGGSTTTANGIPTAAIGTQGNGQFPGNGQLPGNGIGPFAGGGGGLNGEEHLAGTLVSVGSSTVTVNTTAGTATYTVTSASEIVRNGQLATLSSLHTGDSVFVHVYQAGSGSQLTVERLFATSSSASSSSSSGNSTTTKT